MTKEQKAAALARIDKVRDWFRDEETTERLAGLQLVMMDMYMSPSPADEFLRSFGHDTPSRDVAALMMLDLAMTASGILAMDVQQEETAKMN